jgi:hypothetical protein
MDISFLFRNYTWTYLPVKGNEFGNATIKTSVRVGRTSDSTERGASLSPLVLIHIALSASAFFSNNFPHSLFSVPPSHLLVARIEGHRARAQASSGTQSRRLCFLPPSSLMPPHSPITSPPVLTPPFFPHATALFTYPPERRTTATAPTR